MSKYFDYPKYLMSLGRVIARDRGTGVVKCWELSGTLEERKEWTRKRTWFLPVTLPVAFLQKKNKPFGR